MKHKVGRPRKPTAKFELTRESAKRIAQLSKISKYTEKQVFDDALDAGLVAIQDIYESIESFRLSQKAEWHDISIQAQESVQASQKPAEPESSDPFTLYDANSNGTAEARDLAELGFSDERPGPVAAPIDDTPESGTSDPEPLMEHLPE